MDTLRQVLQSMGYHEASGGMWIKPIGYHAFSFHEEKRKWWNWFQRANDFQVELWESHILSIEEEPHFLAILKGWEAYANINSGYRDSQFQRGGIIEL
jgi:hypothetical protein